MESLFYTESPKNIPTYFYKGLFLYLYNTYFFFFFFLQY